MIYVSSDWHGVPLSTIKELLGQANFSQDDYLFVLGDVIDRGDHGIDLLKWMMVQPNVQLILGNHEAMLLACRFLFQEITSQSLESLTSENYCALQAWEDNGAEPTLRALVKETPETRMDILEYVQEAPLYDTVCVGDQDYVLVHGGFDHYSPDKKLKDYTVEELVWARPDYDTCYSSDFITIVGHTPTIVFGREYRGRMMKTKTWWDIDAGAACDFPPMLLCLDTLEEFYLPMEV